jgi:2'-5' RNA ligase
VRVFVAIDISEAARCAIRAYVAKLKLASESPRWVRPEGMHITLKFVGEAKPGLVEQIKSELRGVRSPAPVELRFRGIGYFPNERRPRVLWVGIEASENLADLATDIETRMAKIGIEPESRKFSPHLTLARIESPSGLASLQREIERLGSPDFGKERTQEFFLFQSVLKRGGAEYTKLEAFPFVSQHGKETR